MAWMLRHLHLIVDVEDPQQASIILGQLAHQLGAEKVPRLWEEPYEGEPGVLSFTITKDEAAAAVADRLAKRAAEAGE